MFGRKRARHCAEQLDALQREVRLSRDIVATLQRQVAALSRGIQVPVDAILHGSAVAEIAADVVERYVQITPNLLVLDIRTDAQFAARHIEDAKHLAASVVLVRLQEMPDRQRPILVMSERGEEARTVAEWLVDAGFMCVAVALGGMAAYVGPVVEAAPPPIDVNGVQGANRALIAQLATLLDRDVRPGLQRDGGDLQLVAVEEGIVRIRMVGACHGCGAQKQTLQQGIRTYVLHTFPELREIEAV